MMRPLHMETWLCWYQKSNESKSTYGLNDHMMGNLDAIITLALVMGGLE